MSAFENKNEIFVNDWKKRFRFVHQKQNSSHYNLFQNLVIL